MRFTPLAVAVRGLGLPDSDEADVGMRMTVSASIGEDVPEAAPHEAVDGAT
jgi:hypothetical protein